MYPYRYHRPATVSDAGEMLAEGEDARPLAGGMSLIPVMKHRLAAPTDLVDLGSLGDLVGIAAEPGVLAIGAMTPHATVAVSGTVKEAIPAVAALAGGIGDPLVRNRGTIGGSLANNDPAACYPSAVLALGAEIVTNRRGIAAGDFFTGMFETALESGELIVEVRFPIPAAASYRKFPNPASRFSIVGVFLARFADGAVSVVVTGVGSSRLQGGSIRTRARRLVRYGLAGGTVGAPGRPDRRPPRQRRLPRAPDQGSDRGRGGGVRLSERVAASVPSEPDAG